MANSHLFCSLDHLFCILLAAFNTLQVISATAIVTSLGNTTSGFSKALYCTDDPKWRGRGSNVQDCNEAVKYLYDVEVIKFGAKNFEFLSPKSGEAPPRFRDIVKFRENTLSVSDRAPS